MALPLVSEVTAQVRSLVGDIGNSGAGETYTDAVLLPFVQRAYRLAARYLRAQGVGLLRRQSAAITLTAGQSAISRSVSPTFPVDLLRPLALREKLTGAGTVPYVNMQPGQNNAFLPDMTGQVVTAFKHWDYRDDQILVPVSTQSNDVQILYEADLPAVTTVGDTIKIPDSLDAMAGLVASFVAQSRDEKTNSDRLFRQATTDLDLIARGESDARKAKTAGWGGA